MQCILYAISQLVDVIASQRIYEPCNPADVEDGLLAGDGVTEHASGRRGLADRFWNEAHTLKTRRNVHPLGHPSTASVNTQLNSAIQCRSHTIIMQCTYMMLQ
jgi:hypothetical protein